MKSSTGRTEINLVDSYKYDIAAYRLAELLGLEDILPVTVERNGEGNWGALSWWLPVKIWMKCSATSVVNQIVGTYDFWLRLEPWW